MWDGNMEVMEWTRRFIRRRSHQALNKGAGVQQSDLTIYKGGAQANLSEARSLMSIQPGMGEESLPQLGLTIWADLLSPDGTIATAIAGLDILLPSNSSGTYCGVPSDTLSTSVLVSSGGENRAKNGC